MLNTLHGKKKLQLVLGLVIGILFGFLLQKGGATRYDVILAQLLLLDFTVVKIMMTAVLVGMIGVHILKSLGYARLEPKVGSIGINVVGGLIFGVAFAILGYCPGTVFGAIGDGSMDALVGGLTGMLVGAGLFAAIYPRVNKTILPKGYFGPITFPELLKWPRWVVVGLFAVFIAGVLLLLEINGL